MNTKDMPWFRMYSNFLNDPKMIALAFEDQRHFIGVLALKRAGVVDQQCEPELRDRIVAQRLWIDQAVIRDVKKRLVAAGLIAEDWQPIAWEKNQRRSDGDPTGAERQRRFKAKQGEQQGAAPDPDSAGEEGKTGDGNGNGEGNALSNGEVTPLDKSRGDKRRGEENKENPARKRAAPRKRSAPVPVEISLLLDDGVDVQHATDWLRVRKEKNRPFTQSAWDGVKREAEKAGMTPAAAVQLAAENGWAGFMAKWLASPEDQGGLSPRGSAPVVNRQEALEARNRQVASELAADMRRQQGGRE